MKRRQAITLGVAAALAIPVGLVWWNKSRLTSSSVFSDKELDILSAAVDAIIPETDTSGAKSLGVQNFVALMIQDCYDIEIQKHFSEGLDQLNKSAHRDLGKAFPELNNKESLEVIKGQKPAFLDLLKNLTVRGYSSSEYVLSKTYEFIPGRYLGCVDLKEHA